MNTITKHPVIALRPVVSSQIAAIGHCPETNTLAIQFANRSGRGNVYHYANFTADDYAAFAGADSVGAHFGKHIKPHADKYPYEKIDTPVPTAVATEDTSLD
jgi:hypothetical protein